MLNNQEMIKNLISKIELHEFAPENRMFEDLQFTINIINEFLKLQLKIMGREENE